MLYSLFMGNLPYEANEASIRRLLAPYGEVKAVDLVGDRVNGVFRGFGFVKLEAEDIQALLEALDGKPVGRQALIVHKVNGLA